VEWIEFKKYPIENHEISDAQITSSIHSTLWTTLMKIIIIRVPKILTRLENIISIPARAKVTPWLVITLLTVCRRIRSKWNPLRGAVGTDCRLITVRVLIVTSVVGVVANSRGPAVTRGPKVELPPYAVEY